MEIPDIYVCPQWIFSHHFQPSGSGCSFHIFTIFILILLKVLLGVPLELVHRWWRIALIYLTGVVAGSLTVAIADPHTFIAGASGGVYALITAHLANVIFNWSEMEFPALRLLSFIIIAGVDTGVAVYHRHVGRDLKVILILDNIKYTLHFRSATQLT